MKERTHSSLRLFPFKKSALLALIGLLLFSTYKSTAQTVTIRYQQSVRGGLAKVSNCLVNVPGSDAGTQDAGIAINTAGGTSMSSYADLILPTGSTIVKAYLYIEGKMASTITSVKFRVPGGAYTTLTNTGPLYISTPGTSEDQFAYDVTSLMPATGYVSTVVAGGETTGAGRYAVADVTPFNSSNLGYGWTLYVVYSNPISKYRNITIADVNTAFGCGTGLLGTGACSVCSVTFNIPGISVPSAGAYNAVAVFTGCAGAVGINDEFLFGKQGTTLTPLNDPTINTATATAPPYDLFNSTIGICAKNNVSVDAAATSTPIPMSGNVVSRKPYNGFANPNTSGSTNWYSYFYDSDMMDASGILPNSATPINATVTQNSPDGDCLSGGTYAVSIDVISALVTKTLSPTTIQNGGIATYTWTVDNSLSGALSLAGIGFNDNLPSNLIVAATPGAVLTGGTGGTITATAGASTVGLSGFSLSAGQVGTLTVNVTNKPGQLNASCATNPLAFTNGFTNVVGLTDNLASGISNQCLTVVALLQVELLDFTAQLNNGAVAINWATASEKNNARFDIERSGDGLTYTTIGSVRGNGNSSSHINYNFTDNAPIIGLNYYRLKQVEFYGQSENSYIFNFVVTRFLSNISVTTKTVNNFAEFSVIATEAGTVGMTLYDIAGRKIIQFPDRQFTEGPNTINIDLSTLATGMYFMILSNNDGLQEKIKIIK